MKLVKLAAVLFVPFALAGCSATPEECDPSVELNVFSKAACEFSGSYQKRIDQKDSVLRAEQEVNDALSDEYTTVKNQQSKTRQNVSNQSAQLNKLNKAANTNKVKLAQKQQELAKLKKQISAVKNSQTLTPEAKAKELQRLQSILSEREAAAAAAAGL